MVKTPRRLAAIAAFALALPGASSAAISGLKWTLEEGWLRGLPGNGVVTIALGLEKCTGRAEFDLSALSLSSVPLGIERVNGDCIVQYPSCGEGEREAPRPPVLRGFNAAHDLAEADLRGMRALGATLVRFQLTRSGRNDDLAEYAAWVDSRLDHLVAVLGPARARHLTPCRQPGKGDGEARPAPLCGAGRVLF